MRLHQHATSGTLTSGVPCIGTPVISLCTPTTQHWPTLTFSPLLTSMLAYMPAPTSCMPTSPLRASAGSLRLPGVELLASRLLTGGLRWLMHVRWPLGVTLVMRCQPCREATCHRCLARRSSHEPRRLVSVTPTDMMHSLRYIFFC